MTATQERKSLLTLNGGSTRGKLQAAVLVINRSVHTNLNAANNLRQLLHSVEVDQHKVVDVHTGQLANGRHGAARTAARERLVNLNVILGRVDGAVIRVGALRYRNHQVAGEGQHAHVLAVLADLQEHHNVRASLRIAVLLVTVGAVIAFAGVGADDEDVQRAVLQAVLIVTDVQLLRVQVIAHTQGEYAAETNNDDEHAGRQQGNPAITFRGHHRGAHMAPGAS